MGPEESELIGRYQAGEEALFEELMKLFQDRALSLAWHLTGSRDDALDIVQEAFIRMHRVLPRWEGRASLFTWLYRVITNLARDRIKRISRRGWVSLEVLPEPPDLSAASAPPRRLMASETGARIIRAVGELPPRQREVFVLRHYEGMTLKEIAEIKGRSLGSVKANLFQALRKLRRSLGDLAGGEQGS